MSVTTTSRPAPAAPGSDRGVIPPDAPRATDDAPPSRRPARPSTKRAVTAAVAALVVVALAFGLPAIDGRVGDPVVPAGEPLDIGMGVRVVPPPGWTFDAHQHSPGSKSLPGTVALESEDGTDVVLHAGPWHGDSASLLDKAVRLGRADGIEATGRPVDVSTDAGVGGRSQAVTGGGSTAVTAFAHGDVGATATVRSARPGDRSSRGDAVDALIRSLSFSEDAR